MSDADTATINADADTPAAEVEQSDGRKRLVWKTVLVYGMMPVIVIALAAVAGYLKFQDGSLCGAEAAQQQSVRAATDGAVAMLSYSPDNVDSTLPAAAERLTGPFKDSYTALIDDVVIPGAKEQQISATATVPAAASVSVSGDQPVVVAYVNQSTIIASAAPTDTASVVEVALAKVGDRWMISGFEPR